MQKFTIKVEGAKKIYKKLGELDKKIANKIQKKAFREGAKIIQKAVKEEAPKGETGKLKKSIKVRALKRKKGRIGVAVTIDKKSFDGAFYGAFVDLGTKRDGEEGEKVAIKAREFTKAGFAKSKDKAAAKTIEELKKGIEDAAKS